MQLNPLQLTQHDVRDFDVLCFGSRIIYALNQGRHVGIYEWDTVQKKMVAPKELPDNQVEGTCVNPRFLVLPSGEIRLCVTFYAAAGLWVLRFVDLPIWAR
jgi:hypothetical protein